MMAFLIAFALVAVVALVVTICNISDGLRKAREEMERGIALDLQNTEYDYGHNVKHTSDDE